MSFMHQLKMARRIDWNASIIAIHPAGYAREFDGPSVELTESRMWPGSAVRDGDRGWLDDCQIVAVTRSAEGILRHHVERLPSSYRVGRRVGVTIDRGVRANGASQLCAGRLIELVAPRMCRELHRVASDYRPGRGCIAFGGGAAFPEPDGFHRDLQLSLDALVDANLLVRMTSITASLQRVEIGDFPAFGSVDEHYPPSLGMLDKVTVHSIRIVGGQFQVRFGASSRGIGEELATDVQRPSKMHGKCGCGVRR